MADYAFAPENSKAWASLGSDPGDEGKENSRRLNQYNDIFNGIRNGPNGAPIRLRESPPVGFSRWPTA